MDHPLVLDTRPWRTTALVASAVALVELVILVLGGIALLGGPLARKAQDAAVAKVSLAPKPVVQKRTAAPVLARAQTSVLVLNGNGRSGAAGEMAETVRARGYMVGSTGNAERSDYPRSLVMYRPGFEAEAKRFARDMKISVVGPLDGMAPRDLLGAHLALIIGA